MTYDRKYLKPYDISPFDIGCFTLAVDKEQVEMAVKLIMTWDIAPDHEQDYFEFVINEFVPGVQRLGLQPAEAWATVFGEYPQIQVSILAEGLPDVQRAMNSDSWAQLQDKLFALVQNFSYKVIPARTGFQF